MKFTATYPADAAIDQLMRAAQLCKSHGLSFAVQVLESEIQERMTGRGETVQLEMPEEREEDAEPSDPA